MTQGTPPGRTDSSKLPPFDPSVPNPARMWNYWLGGKDNFAADRELTERVVEASAEMARRYNAMSSASITPRSRDQVKLAPTLLSGLARLNLSYD